MGFLCFPHWGMLRLTVSHEIVPSAWTQCPVDWAEDNCGQVWFRLVTALPAAVQEKLSRLGVRSHKEAPSLAFQQVCCWAAAHPLEPQSQPESPARILVRLSAEALPLLLRGRPALLSQIQLIGDDWQQKVVWAVVLEPSIAGAEFWQHHGQVFTEQVPHLWVPWGWYHPLAEHLPIPAGKECIITPPAQMHFTNLMPIPSATTASGQDLNPLPQIDGTPHFVCTPVPSIPLPLQWSPWQQTEASPALCFIPRKEMDAFHHFCLHGDPISRAGLWVAFVKQDEQEGVLVWNRTKEPGVLLELEGRGQAYVADERMPHWFWPQGWHLRPVLAREAYAALAPVQLSTLVWWQQTEKNSVRCHYADLSIFQPLEAYIQYEFPAPQQAVMLEPLPWEPPTWTTQEVNSETEQGRRYGISNSVTAWRPGRRRSTTTPGQPLIAARGRSSQGWFESWRRWWRKIVEVRTEWLARLRQAWTASTPKQRQAESFSLDHTLQQQLLARAEATIIRMSPSHRLPESYQRLLAHVLESESDERLPEWWAELARWKQAHGQVTDAALCWLMAAWTSPEEVAAADWERHWWRTELQLAQASERLVCQATFWEVGQTRPALGRLAAAGLVQLNRGNKALGRELVPVLLQVLERHAETVPLRACWLGVQAASHLSGGDAVLLARWAERLLERLSRCGQLSEVDLPTSVRYWGHSTSDGSLAAAAAWLVRHRQQVVQWIERLPKGPLRAEGLDGETETTSQVALLLMAWGAAAVGERRRAAEWLSNVGHSSSRLDPEIQPALRLVEQLTAERIQEVGEGLRPRPWPPALKEKARLSLPPAARYAVERLCEYVRILDPYPMCRPLRSWELAPLRDDDLLGERLAVLLEHSDSENTGGEAEELLRLAGQTNEAGCRGRILTALCEVAAGLPLELVQRFDSLLPQGWEALAQWWPDPPANCPTPITHLSRTEVLCRTLENLVRAAAEWPADQAAPWIAQLWQHWQTGTDRADCLLPSTAFLLADVFRRLQLDKQLETLAERCKRAGWLEPHADWPCRLAAATVGLAQGIGDPAERILDEARDRLFLPPAPPPLTSRQYTRLAWDYASTIAFLSLRRRLGRYEELFQRLRPIHLHGSTNRFWTLQPLRLVDIVIRGIVGPAYRLSPTLQQWLNLEDLRIRQRLYRDILPLLPAAGE
ncbi:MAG: hypothetical protein RMJ88_02830 [Thermogemmata sp.]|nr:hypothetical protein [Thermogemmata sp.]